MDKDEDPSRVHRGIAGADRIMARRRYKELEEQGENFSGYQRVYAYACKVGSPPIREARKILMKSFPDKFGSGGKDDLTEATDRTVLGAYRGIVKQARKELGIGR